MTKKRKQTFWKTFLTLKVWELSIVGIVLLLGASVYGLSKGIKYLYENYPTSFLIGLFVLAWLLINLLITFWIKEKK